jgi:hypothetical protein
MGTSEVRQTRRLVVCQSPLACHRHSTTRLEDPSGVDRGAGEAVGPCCTRCIRTATPWRGVLRDSTVDGDLLDSADARLMRKRASIALPGAVW